MPAKPRKDLIDETEPGFYHCYTRCNYKRFLMGKDRLSKKNSKYRKRWVRKRIKNLTRAFGIDVNKFAVLDNHFHLILKNRPDIVESWCDVEVLRRARKAFPSRFRRLGVTSKTKDIPQRLIDDKEFVEKMRARLSSISWFMRQLNSYISRRANAEMQKNGHFFADRFKSQSLEDEFALLLCSVYLDLNEIRAGIVDRPEKAWRSSSGLRIAALKARRKRQVKRAQTLDGFLSPLCFEGDHQLYDGVRLGLRATNDGMFEMPLTRYLQIVDLVGRQIRNGSRGRIPPEVAPLFARLNIDLDSLVDAATNFRRCRSVVAAPDRLRELARQKGRQWFQGVRYLETLVRSPGEQEASSTS